MHTSLKAALLKSSIIALGLLASGCTTEDIASQSSETSQSSWRLTGKAMGAAADPRAVEAGLEAMRKGGTAVDAAIAAHAVLGLVEPQSSGLGGGGYMVVYDRAQNTTTVYDGRETAPQVEDKNLFILDDKVMGFGPAIYSGRSVGTPGAVALYEAAHKALGKRPWDENFTAAIELADKGFEVSPRLAAMLANRRFAQGTLSRGEQTGPYFYPNGTALAAGDTRTNIDYANTLRAISERGPAAFYTGEIAQNIVNAVQSDPNPGQLSLNDLDTYKPRTVPAICGSFKTYSVCSAPPSSSGGVAMNLIMGVYDRIKANSPETTQAADLRDWVIAQQLGYADRDHYVADQDFVTVPVEDLLNPTYLDARATSGFAPGDKPLAGDPGQVLRGEPIIDMWGRDKTEPDAGTSHMSFVDQFGNAVSYTATIETAFGSGRWTNGFLLNNELTDFSRNPELNGKPVANAPAGGKRPRSSMSPTIVFDENGELFMVTGSPGGNSIIGYVTKTLAAVLDWNHTAQEAADLPNVVARGQTVRVETSSPTGTQWAETLRNDGFTVREVQGENSGVHIIVARDDHYEGGADPRREGVATQITVED